LKIVSLSAFHVRIPLRRAILHASNSRTETENLLIRCALENGTLGYGEGVPRDYVTGETVASDIELLQRSSLSDQLVTCTDWAQAVALAERFQLAAVPGDDRGCAGNAARCAVELAMLDAYGQHFGQPLSQVTKIVAPELHQPQAWVRYSGAITSADGLKLRLASLGMRLYGFGSLKIKVGISGQNDVDRMHSVRRHAGREMKLRVDANEAWSANDVVARIRELEPFGITSVEQPVPHSQVDCLRTARREFLTPIMLDESLCSRIDAERAVVDGTCDLFNLRLSKCGGFIATLRLAQYAHEHGIGCQIGCQVGETAILSAAGRHFATSVADLHYLEGSYDRHLVQESLGKLDLTFGRGGRAPALSGPGLSVSIDPAALARVTVRKEVLLD
jgi:L-Ala-D/L-Glu epimerase